MQAMQEQLPVKQLKGSRQSWFESIDRPMLAPLPTQPYVYTDIKTATVNIDYHLQYDDHLYSVPHALVGERVEVHASATLISVYFQHRCVATHPRQYRTGMTTTAAHMPIRHQKQQAWTPGRLMNWAQDLGTEVLTWVKHQLHSREHEAQAYRVCLGLLNLSRQYPPHRVNAACALANRQKLYRLRQIKAILQSNQDTLIKPDEKATPHLPQVHENLRGAQHYH